MGPGAPAAAAGAGGGGLSGAARACLGVDVGAPRKGFDVAVVAGEELVAHLARARVADVLTLARAHGVALAGVDGPCACAPDGERSRPGERELARRVCPIRYTPDARQVRTGGPYYAWVRASLRLHAALAAAGVPAVEVFPTAAWTVWLGPRGSQRRSEWTRAGLRALGLRGVPARTSQDLRDAIAAALTAREHLAGRTRAFGEIVVPAGGALASPP